MAGYGLLGLAAAFVVARGAALVLGAWLTQAQLGGIGVKYDRAVWRELQRSAIPFGLFLVVPTIAVFAKALDAGDSGGRMPMRAVMDEPFRSYFVESIKLSVQSGAVEVSHEAFTFQLTLSAEAPRRGLHPVP
jgi:hypothetical protein